VTKKERWALRLVVAAAIMWLTVKVFTYWIL